MNDDLRDRLADLETGRTSKPSFDSGVTIVLDAEYADREPEADNVVLSSDYTPTADADRGTR